LKNNGGDGGVNLESRLGTRPGPQRGEGGGPKEKGGSEFSPFTETEPILASELEGFQRKSQNV